VVRDVEVLVDAVRTRAVDDERQRALGDVAVLGRTTSVHEIDPGFVVARRWRVETLHESPLAKIA